MNTPNFSGMLDDIFAKHPEPKTKMRTVVGKELELAIKEALKPESPDILYNIHKRSLPPSIDKVIGIGFTKADAQDYIKKHLKTKESHEIVTYYDIVRQDGMLGGILDNKTKLFKEGTDVQQ